MHRYHLVCDERQAEEIRCLALEYGLTEQEVLEQLVDVGLDEVDIEEPRPSAPSSP